MKDKENTSNPTKSLDSLKDANPSLKIGIISQITTILNPSKLFKSYIEFLQPKYSNIISESHFEFSYNKIPKLKNGKILIKHITDLDKLLDVYFVFDSIILLVDVQRASTINEVSGVIDNIIEITEGDPKKIFIFGFYKGENNKNDMEDKISEMINNKNIDFDYDYIDIDIDNIEEFSNVMDLFFKEVHKSKRQANNNKQNVEMEVDNSQSKCEIF